MNLDQCPYIVNSSEPDHTYNCRLSYGHYGPHEDYTGDQEGWWYVKNQVRCRNCGFTADERDFDSVEPYGFPEVRQERKR